MQVRVNRDISPFVETTQWVDALQQHVSPVIQEAGVYHYYAPGSPKSRTLSGVTTLMRKYLVGKRKRGAPKFRAAKRRVKRNGQGLQGRLGGFMRGSLVHRQVEDAVLLDAENFLRRHPDGMHPWARALFDAISAMRLRPLVAEYVVYDLALGAAFRIDFIAVDRKGRLHVFETKTGYVGGAFANDHHAGRWLPGFLDARAESDLPCSPQNQAVIQATLGALMLARTLRLPTRAYKVCVVHLEQNKVRIVQVPRRFLVETGIPVYQHLVQCRQAETPPRKKRANAK